jgi:serine/threonine-protein kinase
MGEVYKGRDPRLNRVVAIKVLPAHLAERAELRKRFKRKAETVANLKHPNICVLYDIGEDTELTTSSWSTWKARRWRNGS